MFRRFAWLALLVLGPPAPAEVRSASVVLDHALGLPHANHPASVTPSGGMTELAARLCPERATIVARMPTAASAGPAGAGDQAAVRSGVSLPTVMRDTTRAARAAAARGLPPPAVPAP